MVYKGVQLPCRLRLPAPSPAPSGDYDPSVFCQLAQQRRLLVGYYESL